MDNTIANREKTYQTKYVFRSKYSDDLFYVYSFVWKSYTLYAVLPESLRKIAATVFWSKYVFNLLDM